MLLPVVLIVWALIIYKVIDFRSGEPVSSMAFRTPTTKEAINAIPDTFTLSLDYQDPFLKKPFRIKKAVSILKKPELRNMKVQWPGIKYYGLVKSRQNGDIAISVDIDNLNYVMKKHQEIKRVKLIRIEPDSIIVSSQGEQKTIYKN